MGLFNRKKDEEQLMRRQSAPQPTAIGEAMRLQQMQQQKMMQGQGMNAQGNIKIRMMYLQ